MNFLLNLRFGGPKVALRNSIQNMAWPESRIFVSWNPLNQSQTRLGDISWDFKVFEPLRNVRKYIECRINLSEIWTEWNMKGMKLRIDLEDLRSICCSHPFSFPGTKAVAQRFEQGGKTIKEVWNVWNMLGNLCIVFEKYITISTRCYRWKPTQDLVFPFLRVGWIHIGIIGYKCRKQLLSDSDLRHEGVVDPAAQISAAKICHSVTIHLLPTSVTSEASRQHSTEPAKDGDLNDFWRDFDADAMRKIMAEL